MPEAYKDNRKLKGGRATEKTNKTITQNKQATGPGCKHPAITAGLVMNSIWNREGNDDWESK